MTEQMTIIQFNYASLDAETRIVVQQRTTEIKGLMKRTAQDIIEIGEKLIEVKLKLGHGAYGEWLNSEFGWTERTAQRFINVSENFETYDNLSDLMIAPSALYLLAAPSTPDEARQAAIERAEAGERITHATAKTIVEEQYAPIWQLERAIRERFDRSKLRKEDVVKRLEELKQKTSAGDVLLESLMTDTNIPFPRRKGDVRQACNNLMEQLKRELKPKQYHCKYWRCDSSLNSFPVSSETMVCEVCGAKHVIGFRGPMLAPGEEQRLDRDYRRPRPAAYPTTPPTPPEVAPWNDPEVNPNTQEQCAGGCGRVLSPNDIRLGYDRCRECESRMEEIKATNIAIVNEQLETANQRIMDIEDQCQQAYDTLKEGLAAGGDLKGAVEVAIEHLENVLEIERETIG